MMDNPTTMEDVMREIKGIVPYALVALLAVGGYYGFKTYRANHQAAVARSFATADNLPRLETAVADYGSSEVGGALKVKLAKAYFDNGDYKEALKLYEELSANPPDGFEGIPAVGKAQTLEALERYDAAVKAYDEYAAANTNSYLTLTARLGSARATALAGKKDAALAALKTLKDAAGDDELAKARIDEVENCVKRL